MRTKIKGKAGESMISHIPFGYCIKNGELVIDPVDGPKVIRMYELYLQGYGLHCVGEAVGISSWHCSIGRILTNKAYIGEGIYPRLISDEVFAKAQQEKYVRAARLGRLNKKHKVRDTCIGVNFVLESIECDIEDPFRKVEYLYSQIKEV